jgi:hypothetical protein
VVYVSPDEFNYPNQWVPLPFEYTNTDTGTFNYELVYQTSVGNIRLDYFFVPLTPSAILPNLLTYDIPTCQFKFVLITGTALSMIKQNHININDYRAVSKITGIWQQDSRRVVSVES